MISLSSNYVFLLFTVFILSVVGSPNERSNSQITINKKTNNQQEYFETN